MYAANCQVTVQIRFYSENRNDLWAIIYSTILLTASLDASGSPAARASAPDGLLPGYQPTTRKLTVNRLSRHKISRHFYDFGSRTCKSAVRNGAKRNAERLICGGSTEPVGVHDLKLAEYLAPVSQRHSPFLCYLIGRKIQCF